LNAAAQRFPTWGTCTPCLSEGGTPRLSEGVHLRLAIEGKNISTYYLFPNFVHISVNIIFKNEYTLIVKYINFGT